MVSPSVMPCLGTAVTILLSQLSRSVMPCLGTVIVYRLAVARNAATIVTIALQSDLSFCDSDTLFADTLRLTVDTLRLIADTSLTVDILRPAAYILRADRLNTLRHVFGRSSSISIRRPPLVWQGCGRTDQHELQGGIHTTPLRTNRCGAPSGDSRV